jgi:IS30 family transposase
LAATSAYRARLSECRAGPYIEDNNFDYINNILKERIIEQNQSIFMILISDKHLREITCESSLRRYISKGYLEVKNYHLKQVKKRKISRKKTLRYETEYLSKERAKYRYLRTFSFFGKYLKEHQNASIVEFDSVVGKRSDKHAILTIYFRKYNFQIGLLIEKGNPYSVVEKVKELFSNFDEDIIRRLFEVCLCDNGTEFSFFPELEVNENGEQIIHTFYTRPNNSTDKAGCERNHRELRDILPKHKSFDGLSQKDLNEIFSHINSKVRKKLKGKSPFSIMAKGECLDIIKKLKIKRIPKKKVRLSPLI